jgi:hypothetical protein
VSYEWLVAGLLALHDIEPYEVLQVLATKSRWPRLATGPDGHRLLTIWGRTGAGRPLIVAVRRLDQWDWQILGARSMTTQELTKFEEWEARQ